ncbi:E3 ubiquitin-protein ligase DTX3L1 isoform X1 [Siniperca chuatsi]|uniref:E3 ubiquitin-protein ligase DTX3L1 isoform X1 n=1 Tax=Siniperca chuatsi TaxID=119488 RepID=UPI001CE0A426|nr:E3 ubiquitin-protein ligase DTX3L1 isoform X1 [Siniperca chuatsi]XP_044032685.1 E3 ubiquitin-protein ligase DTX3L1 isoform X1 [Siniperca chuatsi]XP_044032686.1 E3 ubiquitin-protein ligase DTX3L1 isoform X1 [Siniperca chuatsi]
MGSGQSSDKFHCNRYLNGQGPPSLVQQANEGVNGMHRALNGCQPEGQMTWVILHRDLPGFPDDNTLQMNYVFPDGMQTEKHPHPGQPYKGLRLCAYLPDNREGRRVLKLLDKAFNQQLLFSVATNKDGKDMVTTASIPLKTQPDGGSKVHSETPQQHPKNCRSHLPQLSDSYPDSDYLKIVRKLLKDKGIE